MKLPQGVEIASDIRDMSLMQYEDNGGRSGETHQFVHLSQADAGGGNYLVIETERWAIDSDEIDDFAQMLKDFMAGK